MIIIIFTYLLLALAAIVASLLIIQHYKSRSDIYSDTQVSAFSSMLKRKDTIVTIIYILAWFASLSAILLDVFWPQDAWGAPLTLNAYGEYYEFLFSIAINLSIVAWLLVRLILKSLILIRAWFCVLSFAIVGGAQIVVIISTSNIHSYGTLH